MHLFIKNLPVHLKIFFQTLAAYLLTFGILFGTPYLYCKLSSMYQTAKAAAAVPDPHLKTIPPLTENPVDYVPTDQPWGVPQNNNLLLFPRAWLNGDDNCIFAARLSIMKNAGMIPKDWSFREFNRYFTPKELYTIWGLNGWAQTPDSKILDAINDRINPGSPYRYEWVSISSQDELIYCAKRGQHVLTAITVWLGPDKYNKNARKNRDSNISHAIIIRGIKSYDRKNNLIEYDIIDALPFNTINNVPTFNKFNPKGWSVFNRHGTPYITTGNSARSGYIIRVPKTEKQTAVQKPHTGKGAAL